MEIYKNPEIYASILWNADQFFVSYSVQPLFISVKLFEIGHVVELYVKAALIKFTGNDQLPIKYGHNIKRIWAEWIKDKFFMPNYEIRDTIFKIDFGRDDGRLLSPNDRDHYLKNRELYYITKYLPDIKYLGNFNSKYNLDDGWTFTISFQNLYWIDFIKELRRYLNWPNPQGHDWIKSSIIERKIPDDAIAYLQKLYA